MTRLPLIALTLCFVACSSHPDVGSSEQAATCYRCGPTGAQLIEQHWNELGGANSILGDYKKRSVNCRRLGQFVFCDWERVPSVATVHNGLIQEFEHGRMYWSAVSGAHVVTGEILARYIALGEAAGFGFPFNDDTIAD